MLHIFMLTHGVIILKHTKKGNRADYETPKTEYVCPGENQI